MGRELQKYRIRATRKPAKNRLLSSTVLVRDEEGRPGYCYINFDTSLIDAVGAALPQGVSVDEPAFLEVAYYARTKVWLIKARYLLGLSEVLMWRSEEKPTWLNFYEARNACQPP